MRLTRDAPGGMRPWGLTSVLSKTAPAASMIATSMTCTAGSSAMPVVSRSISTQPARSSSAARAATAWGVFIGFSPFSARSRA